MKYLFFVQFMKNMAEKYFNTLGVYFENARYFTWVFKSQFCKKKTIELVCFMFNEMYKFLLFTVRQSPLMNYYLSQIVIFSSIMKYNLTTHSNRSFAKNAAIKRRFSIPCFCIDSNGKNNKYKKCSSNIEHVAIRVCLAETECCHL